MNELAVKEPSWKKIILREESIRLQHMTVAPITMSNIQKRGNSFDSRILALRLITIGSLLSLYVSPR